MYFIQITRKSLAYYLSHTSLLFQKKIEENEVERTGKSEIRKTELVRGG